MVGAKRPELLGNADALAKIATIEQSLASLQ
jgi:hypothetical protein